MNLKVQVESHGHGEPDRHLRLKAYFTNVSSGWGSPRPPPRCPPIRRVVRVLSGEAPSQAAPLRAAAGPAESVTCKAMAHLHDAPRAESLAVATARSPVTVALAVWPRDWHLNSLR